MKSLATILLVVALTATAASAQVLFNPDLNGTSTPSGYTEVTTAGGTLTYSSGSMTASDFGVVGAQAYITQTGSAPLSNTISSSITFTPNYTYTGGSGGVVDLNPFYLISAIRVEATPL